MPREYRGVQLTLLDVNMFRQNSYSRISNNSPFNVVDVTLKL